MSGAGVGGGGIRIVRYCACAWYVATKKMATAAGQEQG